MSASFLVVHAVPTSCVLMTLLECVMNELGELILVFYIYDQVLQCKTLVVKRFF
mgnify:CR=1 FL=1